ncbi:hypothetical protein C8Q76DRAFT_293478 [Earliella scabrosa]|nr:hypothetical protein C8Q76DRAFT_293478 [Earliella scabrosa]
MDPEWCSPSYQHIQPEGSHLYATPGTTSANRNRSDMAARTSQATSTICTSPAQATCSVFEYSCPIRAAQTDA